MSNKPHALIFRGAPIVIKNMDRITVFQVAELEKACFADPWSLNSLLVELLNPNAVYLTAMKERTLLGYVGMHHIIDEGHITNLAVSPAHRREGIGKLLLKTLISRARNSKTALLTLEARASNTAAIALYGGFGFFPAGLRRGYYNNPVEDALIMTLFLA